jgi:MFS family permease
VPGTLAVGIGVAYMLLRWPELRAGAATGRAAAADAPLPADIKALLLRISAIVFVTAAVSSIIFQSTTFALPKIFDERMHGIAAALAAWLKGAGLSAHADIATMVGAFAFIVFAVASMAQLVVGSLLDRFGPAPVFMTVAAMQVAFFALMPGLTDGPALAVALGFMLGAFGQIPINDYMIGKMASGELRARVYGARYVVSFTALAAALPLIAFVYERWGFDTLFRILALAAAVILVAVALLPRRLPTPAVA